MLYQLSYSRGVTLVKRNYGKEPDSQPLADQGIQPRL